MMFAVHYHYGQGESNPHSFVVYLLAIIGKVIATHTSRGNLKSVLSWGFSHIYGGIHRQD